MPKQVKKPLLHWSDRQLRGVLYHYSKRQASFSEMAGRLGVGADALASFIAQTPAAQRMVAKGRAEGKRRLRSTLFTVAYDGDHKYQGPTLLFLAKNVLGMRDRDNEPEEAIPGLTASESPKTFAELAAKDRQLHPEGDEQDELQDTDMSAYEVE